VQSDRTVRVRQEVTSLSRAGLDWVTFARAVSESLNNVVPFDRCCWHTVDPGTVLLTGSLDRGVECSGRWLAEHEYVIEDVNKWWFLARSGRMAGATSLATCGDLSRSARHRSQEADGIGDELRGSFVADGNYWGAAGFLRDSANPWFTEADVQFLASLSATLGSGLRSALLQPVAVDEVSTSSDGPGVVVFDECGRAEFVSPAAEQLIAQMVEEPTKSTPGDSVAVQAVAACVRAQTGADDPLRLDARSRVQTRSGSWLLLYGTPLAGERSGRTAVVIQPAAGSEVAPLVALAYGLSARECQVVRLCMEGRSTREMAAALLVSPYTVQDHLKSIFNKTSVRSRHELVGRVFLEHYLPRWDDLAETAVGWTTSDLGHSVPSGVHESGQSARVAPPSTGMTMPER
jgi:DNA-binding CsgD family transcriptional regulator